MVLWSLGLDGLHDTSLLASFCWLSVHSKMDVPWFITKGSIVLLLEFKVLKMLGWPLCLSSSGFHNFLNLSVVRWNFFRLYVHLKTITTSIFQLHWLEPLLLFWYRSLRCPFCSAFLDSHHPVSLDFLVSNSSAFPFNCRIFSHLMSNIYMQYKFDFLQRILRNLQVFLNCWFELDWFLGSQYCFLNCRFVQAPIYSCRFPSLTRASLVKASFNPRKAVVLLWISWSLASTRLETNFFQNPLATTFFWIHTTVSSNLILLNRFFFCILFNLKGGFDLDLQKHL